MAKFQSAHSVQEGLFQFPATALALEQVLTSENQLWGPAVSDAASISGCAPNKAGYETWWLGNHNRMANGTSAYGLVAEAAKHNCGPNPAPQDDNALLDLLKKYRKMGIIL